jgi:hypothetical protein
VPAPAYTKPKSRPFVDSNRFAKPRQPRFGRSPRRRRDRVAEFARTSGEQTALRSMGRGVPNERRWRLPVHLRGSAERRALAPSPRAHQGCECCSAGRLRRESSCEYAEANADAPLTEMPGPSSAKPAHKRSRRCRFRTFEARTLVGQLTRVTLHLSARCLRESARLEQDDRSWRYIENIDHGLPDCGPDVVEISDVTTDLLGDRQFLFLVRLNSECCGASGARVETQFAAGRSLPSERQNLIGRRHATSLWLATQSGDQ